MDAEAKIEQQIATHPMSTEAKIKQQIATHPILLYMKGTPQRPQCGFSGQAVQLLETSGITFATVDVLEDPELRIELPKFADWPTFPQLWVNGELIGGCDIMLELARQGELQPLLQQAVV